MLDVRRRERHQLRSLRHGLHATHHRGFVQGGRHADDLRDRPAAQRPGRGYELHRGAGSPARLSARAQPESDHGRPAREAAGNPREGRGGEVQGPGTHVLVDGRTGRERAPTG